MPVEDIQTVLREHAADPGKRKAQHLLATEVLGMVHGFEEAEKIQQEHQKMRAPSLASMQSQHAEKAGEAESTQENSRITLSKSQVLNTPIAHILHSAGLAKSKSEAARMVDKGGVYIASNADSEELNFVKVTDSKAEDIASLLVENLLILRLGKWRVRVVEVLDD